MSAIAGPLRRVVRATLVAGSIASVSSTLVLSAATRARGHPAAGGTNATSHWLWGREAFRYCRADARHTAVGYAIHHLSSLFWAAGYAAWNERRAATAPRRALRAATVAAIAAAVDYRVVPRRLTPGFEAHLRPPAIAGVYAAFALGLLLGDTLLRIRRRR